MTDKRINEAIAKSRGWKKIRIPKMDDLGPIGNLRVTRWISPNPIPGQIKYLDTCLDYVNDLNAMQDLERTMDEPNYRLFVANLVGCLKPGEFAVRATARQRAEAYLKMRGLWVY